MTWHNLLQSLFTTNNNGQIHSNNNKWLVEIEALPQGWLSICVLAGWQG